MNVLLVYKIIHCWRWLFKKYKSDLYITITSYYNLYNLESNGQRYVIMNICTQPSNEKGIGGCIIDNDLKQLLTKETCISLFVSCFLLDPQKITLLDIIGSGSYGIVRRGMKVAAKVLHFPERTSCTIQCELNAYRYDNYSKDINYLLFTCADHFIIQTLWWC